MRIVRKLTEAFIESMPANGRDSIVFDQSLPGFGIRTTAASDCQLLHAGFYPPVRTTRRRVLACSAARRLYANT